MPLQLKSDNLKLVWTAVDKTTRHKVYTTKAGILVLRADQFGWAIAIEKDNLNVTIHEVQADHPIKLNAWYAEQAALVIGRDIVTDLGYHLRSIPKPLDFTNAIPKT